MLEMRLVTGHHDLEPIRELLSAAQRDPSYQQYSPRYTTFGFEDGLVDTWKAEIYVLYHDGRPVGLCYPNIDRVARMVHNIRPTVFLGERSKGYGTYMLAWCCQHYFGVGFHRVGALVYATNLASLRMCRRLFSDEIVAREEQLLQGQYVDVHYFSKLAREHDPQQHKELLDSIWEALQCQ